MLAVICDRCKKLKHGTIKESGYVSMVFKTSEPKETYMPAHLCPECADQIISIMENLALKEGDGNEQTDHHRESDA